jgi:hypothetical protein
MPENHVLNPTYELTSKIKRMTPANVNTLQSESIVFLPGIAG